MRTICVVVGVGFALSGCVAEQAAPDLAGDAPATATSADSPSLGPSPSTHPDPQSSLAPPTSSGTSPRGDDAPVVRQGPVVDVVDGDTIDLADGTRVRLAIVDTPEVHGGVEPCGPEATDLAGSFLAGEAVAVYRPTDAPQLDDFDRLLGEVVRVSDGASLNVALVAAGLGSIDDRFTGEDPDLTARLRAAAEDAPTPTCASGGQSRSAAGQETNGATTTTAAVTITDVRFDGPGNDVEYNDSEYVVLTNRSDATVDLSGWQVADDDGNSVTIGSGYAIDANETFRVHTGPGDNDPASSRWYAGASQAYLNNSGGDDLRLLDATGTTVAVFSYVS